MKRGGGLHPANLTGDPNKAAPGNTGRANRRQRDERVTPEGCAPVLAHDPSFGRNPRGSPDFRAYAVPKACYRQAGGRNQKWPHHPYLLGGPKTPWKCSITPVFLRGS